MSYHNKGQRDGARNKYKPPHGLLDDLLTWSESGMKKMNKDNGEYRKGWNNGYKGR